MRVRWIETADRPAGHATSISRNRDIRPFAVIKRCTPPDQFSSHCVRRASQRAKWTGKAMNMEWKRFFALRTSMCDVATAWRSNILVNSFVVTFKLAHHRRERWPVRRSRCAQRKMCLEMSVIDTQWSSRDSSRSRISINELFVGFSPVVVDSSRRLMLFASDLNEKPLAADSGHARKL